MSKQPSHFARALGRHMVKELQGKNFLSSIFLPKEIPKDFLIDLLRETNKSWDGEHPWSIFANGPP